MADPINGVVPAPSSHFPNVGGHRILNLANTVSWRLDPARATDRLDGDDAAWRWVLAFGLCSSDEEHALEAKARDGLAETARAIREDVYSVIVNRDEGSAAALYALDREWTQRASLTVSEDGRWVLAEQAIDERTIELRLAHDAVEFLLNNVRPLRQCSDEACGWVFIDTSPRRNRRWCADSDCGARNRVRAQYRRRRRETTEGDAIRA